jgi:3-carboxymuconate cyclase
MEEIQRYFIYIGSYAASEQSGIHIYSLDEHSGQLDLIDQLAGIDNPSYLAFNSQQTRIYAVSETQSFQGQPGGSVVALTRDPATGKLAHLNQLPTDGADPCYVTIDPTDSMLMLVNYSGGSFCAYSLDEDGSIAQKTDFIQQHGKGFRADRQEGPHPHSIVLDQRGKNVLLADLGLDKIFAYRLDLDTKKFVAQSVTSLTPGTGPRHTTFSANGNYVYIINELASSINVFTYDSDTTTLRLRQTISTLPAEYTGKNISADIHISPDGRFLYGSNRGHDSIAVYRIDQDNGTLSFIQHVATGGRTPRNFAITAGGRFLLAANQDTDSVVVFKIDQDRGTLEPTGTVLNVPQPVCIKLCAAQ